MTVASPRAAETGLIVRVRLPRTLEAVRRVGVRDAGSGLPAHVTLLYPFVQPDAFDRRLRDAIAEVIARHAAFPCRLAGPARWPEVLYASVEPEAPFRSLQADLAAAFPGFPIYGGSLDFVPHVTIAEGAPAAEADTAGDPAWATLPTTLAAHSVELIARERGAWKTKWRFVLRPSIRVLVCGERLRGDDAAAPLAAERLPRDVRSLAEVIEVGQLSVEALLDVPERMAVVVADAAVGVRPGEVVTMPLAGITGRGAAAAPASSHALPPDQVLVIADEMRGSPLRGSFVGIGGADFGLGQRLSPAVEAGLAGFGAALAGEIRRLAGD